MEGLEVFGEVFRNSNILTMWFIPLVLSILIGLAISRGDKRNAKLDILLTMMAFKLMGFIIPLSILMLMGLVVAIESINQSLIRQYVGIRKVISKKEQVSSEVSKKVEEMMNKIVSLKNVEGKEVGGSGSS